MLKVTRKRLSTLIYCLVAMNLLLAPVAHASIMTLSETHNHTSTDHHCDSDKADLLSAVSSKNQHGNHMNGNMSMNCDNGNTCKVLCSISVSMLYPGDSSIIGFEKPNRWHLKNPPSLRSSFLSRLERPPRL